MRKIPNQLRDLASWRGALRRAVIASAALILLADLAVAAQELSGQIKGTQEVINSTNAELGAVVDDRRVLELPLNGRNASHLALLQAGVYF